jgi:hypothetical protein
LDFVCLVASIGKRCLQGQPEVRLEQPVETGDEANEVLLAIR